MFFSTRKRETAAAIEALRQLELPVGNGGWWVRHPERALHEISIMADSTNAALLTDGETMIWEETLENNFGSRYRVRIKAKDFPFKAPNVFVVWPSVTPSHAKHMYNDGRLCLFHPDDFNSRMSLLEIRNLAAAWCFAVEVFEQTNEWPAAQRFHL